MIPGITANSLMITTGQIPLSISFVGHAYARNTSSSTSMTFDAPSTTILPGDLIFACGLWNQTGFNGESGTIDGVNMTKINDISSGALYPQGVVYRAIATTTNPEIIISNTGLSNSNAGAAVIFRPNKNISNVSLNNASLSEAAALGLDSTLPIFNNLLADRIRIKVYFLSGRPLSSSVQNPTPTFQESGWTHVDGEGNRSGLDDMDYAYKIETEEGPGVDETITTNDAGRQAHFIISTDWE